MLIQPLKMPAAYTGLSKLTLCLPTDERHALLGAQLVQRLGFIATLVGVFAQTY